MASLIIRDSRFPVASNVSLYLSSQKGRPSNPQLTAPNDGTAPSGAAVAGPVAVAADGSVTFTGLADGTGYTAYAVVNSYHVYADARTDPPFITEKGRESRVRETTADAKRRLWLPGQGIEETINRPDVVSNAIPLTSGTLLLAGGAVIRAKQPVSRIGFVSGTTAGATLTAQWFALIRQSDLAVLAKTVDDAATAWPANTLKELALSAPYTPDDDTAVYLACLVAATTPPSLMGVAFANAVMASLGGVASTVCGTSTTGLTNPASLGANAAAITATVNWAYGFAR
jgi:hypothetical protein